jgi:hypothetical protein
MKTRQFFEDDVGALSCMRLIFFLVNMVVLGVWAFANITSNQYVPLGYAEASILAASYGGKALQSRFEINS